MDFALQTALLGATVGGAVLALSTLYGASLSSAPRAFRWWAAAFLAGTCSQAVVLAGGVAGWAVLPISDLLHGLAALLTLLGARSLMRKPVGILVPLVGVAAVFGWVEAAAWLRHAWGLIGVPIFGIGGPPQLLAAWVFLSKRSSGLFGWKISDGQRAAGFAFFARGLYQLAGPVFALHAEPATWGFVLGQILSMVMAVALLLVVLRRQAALTDSVGERVAMLQTRLLDALGGVQDAVALYDSDNRLVTWNERYVDALGPCRDLARSGTHLRTVLRGLVNSGWVVNIQVGQDRRSEALEEDGFFSGAELSAQSSVREHQHADGRWMSVNTYPTADGGHLRILTDITPRKQAERALEDSLAWVRGIMETVVDGLIALDEAGLILSLNPAACRIFGFRADEVIGGDAARFVTDGGAFAPGPLREVEGRRKNGEVFPLEVAVSEMRQGDYVTYIAVVRDITGRKRIEGALVESEQRLRDLAEAASDWFWETDENLVFTFVSGRVRPVLGVGPEFFLGQSFADLRSSCLDPATWDEQMALMGACKPFRGLVLRHVLPSSEVRYVELSGRPASGGGGCRGFRGTASDITTLKWHEHELAAQSALRQGIIDNVTQGIVAFDERDHLAAINRVARRQLDLPADGPVQAAATFGGFMRHLNHRGHFAGDTVVPLDRLRGGEPRVLDYVQPTGTVLEVWATTMPDGGPILTFSDVTERRRGEETLREAKEAAERGNRAKATFLANISHELRTPLNAIIGFSEMMKHEIYGPLEPASYREYVTDINDSGQHLLELINDVLDMSKAEVGMTDLVEGEVDVMTIVRSAMRMMATRAQKHGIAVVDDLPADLPPLFADERRIRQIVLNLLSNAVKFTEEGGRVVTTAYLSEEGFVLVIADTGIGMNAEDLERVMAPFVQVDSRLSRRFEGSGLGLPLAEALVVAHRGRLRLESVVGKGTTATVIFPPDRIVRVRAGHMGVGGGI